MLIHLFSSSLVVFEVNTWWQCMVIQITLHPDICFLTSLLRTCRKKPSFLLIPSALLSVSWTVAVTSGGTFFSPHLFQITGRKWTPLQKCFANNILIIRWSFITFTTLLAEDFSDLPELINNSSPRLILFITKHKKAFAFLKEKIPNCPLLIAAISQKILSQKWNTSFDQK